MSERILILGGTREAAALAVKLVDDGKSVITSLAGRTKEPSPVSGELRTGGFGGPEAMAHWITENAITRVIDATHPFAVRISQNAQKACQLAGVDLEVKIRPPWEKQSGDIWVETNSLENAASAIPLHSRVLLALGSQHLTEFTKRDDVHFIVRMVDRPIHPLPFNSLDLVMAKPSADWMEEAELLKHHRVTHIVCRNSGGEGAYAKIEAARRLAMPVIIVTMPT